MDFVAIMGANYFLKRRRKCVRLVIVAAFSSVIGLLLMLVVRNEILYQLIVHFLINTLMVFAGFGRCRWQEFIENWAVTYLAVIVLGGIGQWMNQHGFAGHQLLLQMLATAVAGYGVVRYLIQRRNFGNHIFPVRLIKDTRVLEVNGYMDSGNQLQDPYTGQCICILSHRKGAEFLNEKRDLIRYVPYQSLGEKEGLLAVTNVEAMVLYVGGSQVRIEHMAIGIANEGLLEGKEYDLILHASLL